MDAMHSTRAAVEEGTSFTAAASPCCGLGTSQGASTQRPRTRRRREIVRKALFYPARQIAIRRRRDAVRDAASSSKRISMPTASLDRPAKRQPGPKGIHRDPNKVLCGESETRHVGGGADE